MKKCLYLCTVKQKQITIKNNYENEKGFQQHARERDSKDGVRACM